MQAWTSLYRLNASLSKPLVAQHQKCHGIGRTYLKDFFTLLPATTITQIREFKPAAWAKAKEKIPAQAA